MSELNELKPCPFCGGAATAHYSIDGSYVRCDFCGARPFVHKKLDNAIKAWNARAVKVRNSEGDNK